MMNPNQQLIDLDNSFITFNNLISICQIRKEENDSKNIFKLIMRKDNSNDILSFKQISESKYDYLNISDSFFYIRDIEESKIIYGIKTREENNSDLFSKEIHFSKNEKIKQSTQFILQHMLSRKFISCILNIKNNKITLILVNEVESAYPFTLQKLNKLRLSKFYLKYNQIFYLNIFVKEENMNYYVEEEENKEENINNNNNNKNNEDNKYTNIVLNRNSINRYYLMNQSYILNDINSIYSGHLINIIFTKKKKNLLNSQEHLNEKKMMLCLKHNKPLSNSIYHNISNNKDISNEKDLNITEESIIQENYEVSVCEYTEDLCDQVTKYALWVIEDEEIYLKGSLNINLINTEKKIRIRNALTGLYLSVKKKVIKIYPIKNY